MQALSLSSPSDPAHGGGLRPGPHTGKDTPGRSLGVTWKGPGSSHWRLSMFRPENPRGTGKEGGVLPLELHGSMGDVAASL